MELRPYQLRCKHLAHEALRQGRSRVIVCAPTGAGKRVLMVHWAATAVRQGRNVLIVSARRLDIEQAADGLYYGGVKYGVVMQGYDEMRHHAVQVATIQSLETRYLNKGLSPPPADLILIDEAHRHIAGYRRLLAQYPAAKVLMFTATPVGADGASLARPGYADVLTEGVTNSQLIRQSYLLPMRVFAPSEPDIRGMTISRATGEYPSGPLGSAILGVTSFANVFDEFAPFADRQTICFAPSIAYANGLANGPGDSFRARGVPCAVMHSGVKPASRRKEILKAFEQREIRVLVSVDVLRENFDCPIASCGIDLQPNGQLRSWWQKLGRVKRPYEGQQEAIWIDMAGNYWKFDLHPDDDPDWKGVDRAKTTMNELLEKRPPAPALVRCPRCSHVYRAGPRCPDCGYEPKPREVIRRIRMGNGKLKEIPATRKQKVVLTQRQRMVNHWQSALWAAHRSGKTVKQAAWMCKHKFGVWPEAGWPGVPSEGSTRWRARVSDLFTKAELVREFKHAAND